MFRSGLSSAATHLKKPAIIVENTLFRPGLIGDRPEINRENTKWNEKLFKWNEKWNEKI